jgi:hypothetical protein
LRELLKKPTKFTPIIEDARRGYQFAGALDSGVLLGVCEVQVSGVPGRDRFAVGGLNARFSGEFDVNRAA